MLLPDVTAPELLAFTLDLSQNTLDIMFDEMVEHWSIKPVYIQLLSSDNTSDVSTQYMRLTNYSIVLGDVKARLEVF